jgi:hypothetical protein
MGLYVTRLNDDCLATRTMPAIRVASLFALVLLLMLHRDGKCAEPATTKVENLRAALLDLEGRPHLIRPEKDVKGWAIVFLSTECPIARSYIAPLNDLTSSWKQAESPLRFFGVISDPTVTRKDASKFIEDFDVKFPVLFDASGQLAGSLKPTHVPEAFVFDRDLKLVYRGRIDDTYAQVGKRRPEPTKNDLRDAMASLLAGKTPEITQTKPIGCPFEDWTDGEGKVTYTRDIAPVMRARCTNCHRDTNGTALTLETYRSVSDHARSIINVLQKDGLLKEHAAVFGPEGITGFERKLFARWAQSLVPEGKPDDLPNPQP